MATTPSLAISSKRRLHPRLQPQHLVHHPLLLQRRRELVPLLGEMAPRLKVHRNEHVSLQLLEQPRSVLAIQGNRQRAGGQLNRGFADVEERDRDILR